MVVYQRDVLGVVEDPRLEGLHDDYYITSIIMNDDPQHVRLEQRIKAGKASINGIRILPAEKTIEHGRRIIEFRTDAQGDPGGHDSHDGQLAGAVTVLRHGAPLSRTNFWIRCPVCTSPVYIFPWESKAM